MQSLEKLWEAKTADFKIRDFIKAEITYLKDNCNFTEEEEQYFDMKSRDASDVETYMTMCISERKVTELSQRVKVKIIKVAIS